MKEENDMSQNLLLFIVVFLAVVYYLYYLEKNKKQVQQLSYIMRFTFPKRVNEIVSKTYPHLTHDEIDQVLEGLRDYFYISNQAKGKIVSMPSQAVDVAWHEFILFTKAYQNFCQKAFGKFFHHHPAEAMKSKTTAQEGIKRAWSLACEKEGIYPKSPNKLPLLFAIDSQLNITDGFKYTLHCKAPHASSSSTSGCGGFCASHIGCGGAASGGCNSGCSGDSGSSGCGGGCGGS